LTFFTPKTNFFLGKSKTETSVWVGENPKLVQFSVFKVPHYRITNNKAQGIKNAGD